MVDDGVLLLGVGQWVFLMLHILGNKYRPELGTSPLLALWGHSLRRAIPLCLFMAWDMVDDGVLLVGVGHISINKYRPELGTSPSLALWGHSLRRAIPLCLFVAWDMVDGGVLLVGVGHRVFFTDTS